METVLVFEEGGGWERVRGDGCSSDRMTGVTEIVARWGTWRMREGPRVCLIVEDIYIYSDVLRYMDIQ